MDSSNFPTLILGIVILLYSAILHEIAHGYVANRLGDPTARLLGRLTLNPIKHIDPFMSIILPFILVVSGSPFVFGAAKPVPVDEFNLRDGRTDMALVALAGPLTNVILACIGALLIHILEAVTTYNQISQIIFQILHIIVRINLILAFVNFIPIPPLDGSKMFATLLPPKDARTYLSFGSIGLVLVFFLLAFPISGFSLSTQLIKLLLFSEQLLGL